MAIQMWQPGRDLVSLREAMDKIWEDSFHAPSRIWGGFHLDSNTPAIDMYLKGDDLIVKVTVPGMKAEDLDVTIAGDMLTIRGESKMEEEVAHEDYIYQERRYGSFSRTLPLPRGLNTDKVDAKFDRGILTLRIPKTAEAKAKSVKVKVESAQSESVKSESVK